MHMQMTKEDFSRSCVKCGTHKGTCRVGKPGQFVRYRGEKYGIDGMICSTCRARAIRRAKAIAAGREPGMPGRPRMPTRPRRTTSLGGDYLLPRYVPTPAEIIDRAREIRAGWTMAGAELVTAANARRRERP